MDLTVSQCLSQREKRSNGFNYRPAFLISKSFLSVARHMSCPRPKGNNNRKPPRYLHRDLLLPRLLKHRRHSDVTMFER